MIDYYYLLKQGTTTDEKAETIANLKRFNMFKFASAVMYIMKEDLGLEDKYLLMEPNKKIGKLLEKKLSSVAISVFMTNASRLVASLCMSNTLLRYIEIYILLLNFQQKPFGGDLCPGGGI